MKRYSNTLTTTVWRMIEHAGEDMPMLGAIGLHPREFGNGKPNFRHLIPSVSFARQFDFPNMETLSEIIQFYAWGNKGPLGAGEVILDARDGTRHEFRFETFYNGYDAITLGCHVKEVPLIVAAGIFTRRTF